jgi:hypothetical protein
MSDSKLLLVLLFWVWTFVPSLAQDMEDTSIKGFCQPGVDHQSPGRGLSVEYSYFPGYRQTSSSTDDARVNVNLHFLAKFKIPLVNTPKTKVLLGCRYFEEVYQIKSPAQEEDWLFYNLDGKKLKSHRFSLALSRAIGSNHYLGLKAETSFNGDYGSFLSLDRGYRESFLIGMLGRKKEANKEWGLGWVTRFGYRGMASFPFLMYNQTFNARWGLETTLPVKAKIRYRFSDVALLLFGGEMVSRNYAVELEKGPRDRYRGDYGIVNSEAQLSLSFQHQLSNWLWMEMKTGYVYYLNAQADGQESLSDIAFGIDKGDSGFLKLGLFLSPPKSYRCEK